METIAPEHHMNEPPSSVLSDITAGTLDDQPLVYKDPTLRVRVQSDVLMGGNSGPFRKSWTTRLRNRIAPKSAVKVETLMVPGLSTSVLYAREDISQGPHYPFADTELTSGQPDGNLENLVYQDSPFEIRVSGMLAKNYDFLSSDNELMLYSVQTDPNSTGDDGQGLPYIHFDHRSDAYQSIERANTFIPIPASKSFVTGSPGAYESSPKKRKRDTSKDLESDNRKSVNVQFKIIEMDEPSETVTQSIAGIDSLAGIFGDVSRVAPTLSLLSPALSIVSAVSKHALDSYAKPDKVISIDMDFLLADRSRVAAGTAPSGEYLRYGYYFFLSEPVEAKLYASVLTPKNVLLMLRRSDYDASAPRTFRGRPIASRKFFPLTDVSYIVVRVCEPIQTCQPKRRPVQLAHAKELEQIFSRANTSQDPKEIAMSMVKLGKELGFIENSS